MNVKEMQMEPRRMALVDVEEFMEQVREFQLKVEGSMVAAGVDAAAQQSKPVQNEELEEVVDLLDSLRQNIWGAKIYAEKMFKAEEREAALRDMALRLLSFSQTVNKVIKQLSPK